ncbi:hypothetical protein ACOSQ4_010571 [Xanthoceras sorbifolium]
MLSPLLLCPSDSASHDVGKMWYKYDCRLGDQKEIDDIFESDVDEVKSLSDLHEDGLDGLDDNLFVVIFWLGCCLIFKT